LLHLLERSLLPRGRRRAHPMPSWIVQ
jgi:hypothetical protein